jgi:hypothetical protein
MVERTTLAVDLMSGSVEGAVKAMSTASGRMQEAVATIAQVTGNALNRMNDGADTLMSASTSFAQAGERVSAVMTQAVTVTGKLTELSGVLSASSNALQQAVADYRAQHDAVAGLVRDLKDLVASAKTEASLTADVLARLDASAAKLNAAQLMAGQYLDGVSRVLGEAHQAFADATRKTLERANTDFHAKLSSSVHLLSSTIQELETTLGAR